MSGSCLGNGESLEVDHVIVTSGHTDNVVPDGEVALIPAAVPGRPLLKTIPAGAVVGVEGMGLVATDVIMALTLGRGGSYAENGDRLRYLPSGRRADASALLPKRFPYCSKAVATVDESDQYEAVVCTREAIGAIQGGPGTGAAPAPDRLPLPGPTPHPRRDAGQVLRPVGRCWQAAAQPRTRSPSSRDEPGRTARRRLSSRPLPASYGEFDPWAHFFGPRHEYVSSKDYESQIYSLVESDLGESLRGGAAPVKSAYEVFRHLRDLMRTVIEFRGLTLESYLDFRDNIKTRVNRIVAGPPALRSQQLLALMDADIVRCALRALPLRSSGPGPGIPSGLAAFRTAAFGTGGLAHPRTPRKPDRSCARAPGC